VNTTISHRAVKNQQYHSMKNLIGKFTDGHFQVEVQLTDFLKYCQDSPCKENTLSVERQKDLTVYQNYL
jgi:hypothetical protein